LKCAGIREVAFESGAGGGAQFDDDAYSVAGASVVANRALAWDSDIVLAVRPPDSEAIKMTPEGSTYVGHVQPAFHKPLVDAFLEQKVNTLAMDCVPRHLSRAQAYDAYDTLSSTANIAGYRAVIEAANVFGHFFTGKTFDSSVAVIRNELRFAETRAEQLQTRLRTFPKPATMDGDSSTSSRMEEESMDGSEPEFEDDLNEDDDGRDQLIVDHGEFDDPDHDLDHHHIDLHRPSKRSI
jgi:hypothetical protein